MFYDRLAFRNCYQRTWAGKELNGKLAWAISMCAPDFAEGIVSQETDKMAPRGRLIVVAHVQPILPEGKENSYTALVAFR